MKIIYMGTPEIALKPLIALIEAGHTIVACVTQPDKVNSRGNKIIFSPIKNFALENNIPVYQFTKIRLDGVEILNSLDADLIITCAYGQILSQEIIDLFKFGVLNIHSSLLPKYRGASPIIASLLNGDEVTGVTIMQTSIGMDEGDILLSEEVKIEKEDNSISLTEKISEAGARCICEVVNNIELYFSKKTTQNNEKATFCKKVTKEMAKLDFNKDATTLVREIKAYALNPTSFFIFSDKRFKVFNAEVVECENEIENGTIISANKTSGLVISCLNGAIKVIEIQAPNGRKMKIRDFLNGNTFPENARCE